MKETTRRQTLFAALAGPASLALLKTRNALSISATDTCEAEWQKLSMLCDLPNPSAEAWQKRDALERIILSTPPTDMQAIALMVRVCERLRSDDQIWGERTAMATIAKATSLQFQSAGHVG